MRVVGAEDPLTIGQGALKQRDRLVQAPRRPVGAGEAVARAQGVAGGRRRGPARGRPGCARTAAIASSRRPADW